VCEQNPADIFFVLDASSSIWPPHFQLQLDFVNNVVDEFKIGSDFAHIGVLTFGDTATTRLNMGELVSDEAAMQVKIKKIPQQLGNTFTHDALELMRQVGIVIHNIISSSSYLLQYYL
jgi:uncharacterized protein YegL